MIHFDLSLSPFIFKHVTLNHMRAHSTFLVSRVRTTSRCGKNTRHRRNSYPLRQSSDPGNSFNFHERLRHTRFPFVAFRRRLRQRFCIRLKQRDHAMNFERWCARKKTQIRGGMRTESQIARTFLFTRWASLVVNHRVRWVVRARAKGERDGMQEEECLQGGREGRG